MNRNPRLPDSAVSITAGSPTSLAELFALQEGREVDPQKLRTIGAVATVLAERNLGLSAGAAASVLLALTELPANDSAEPQVMTANQGLALEGILAEVANAAEVVSVPVIEEQVA